MKYYRIGGEKGEVGRDVGGEKGEWGKVDRVRVGEGT